MSLRFEKETNVYDHEDQFLGRIDEGNGQYYPLFVANENAEISVGELREIADYLEGVA